MYIPCRILTAPIGRVWRLIAFSRRSAPKNTIRLPPSSGEADTKEERIHIFKMYYLIVAIKR